LAISVVATRAATTPGLSLAAIAGELRDASTRLDALEAGDLDANVRATLSWSYEALPPDARRVLTLVALTPAPDIDVFTAAGLVDAPVPDVRGVLRDLEHAHLLQQHGADRYHMHDLVRLYAMEQACDDHSAPARAAALHRLVDHYLHTAHAGDLLLAPQRPPITLDEQAPGCRPRPLADPAAALAWFQAEHAGLVAAQSLAWSNGWDGAVWQLAWVLNTFQNRRGHVHEQVVTWQLGLAATERLDDAVARSLAHRWLGHAFAQVDRDDDALGQLRRALALAEHSGDTASQAHIHHLLARACEQGDDDLLALDHSREALRLYRTLANPVWVAQALNALGWYQARLGDFAAARTACEAAFELHDRHRYQDGQAGTLDSLGYIAYHTHDHDKALEYFGRALTIYRDRGNMYGEAEALDHLGAAHLAVHRPDRARTTWLRALELYHAQFRALDADRVRQRLAALTQA
jgi:tetratricopeptide (TPR) repeat protein